MHYLKEWNQLNRLSQIKRIYQLKNIFTKKLNDTFIWTTISRKNLEEQLLQNNFMENNIFQVPSRRKDKRVKRQGEECLNILKDAIKYDMHYSALVLYVSMFENYLEEISKIILESNYERLLDYKDKEFIITAIDDDIIELCKKNDILRDNIIKQQISLLSYKSTDRWKEFFENILELDLNYKSDYDDDREHIDLWNEWKECKLIRNLIIHNGGYVDEVYIKKSVYKQFSNGEKVQISDEYIFKVIVMLKHFAGKIANRSKMIDSFYSNIKISEDYIAAGKEMEKDFEHRIRELNILNKFECINVNVKQNIVEMSIYINYNDEISDKDIATMRRLLESLCKKHGIIRNRVITLNIISNEVKKYNYILGGSWKREGIVRGK